MRSYNQIVSTELHKLKVYKNLESEFMHNLKKFVEYKSADFMATIESGTWLDFVGMTVPECVVSKIKGGSDYTGIIYMEDLKFHVIHDCVQDPFRNNNFPFEHLSNVKFNYLKEFWDSHEWKLDNPDSIEAMQQENHAKAKVGGSKTRIAQERDRKGIEKLKIFLSDLDETNYKSAVLPKKYIALMKKHMQMESSKILLYISAMKFFGLAVSSDLPRNFSYKKFNP
jgi:hypothetical protein